MRILLTGVAGFIGSKVAELLLGDGHDVVGVDDLNDAYDRRLKEYRLQGLLGRSAQTTQAAPSFTFERLDICDRPGLDRLARSHGPFDAVINLAARAGVRPSVEDPWVYVETNMTGTLNLLELCRHEGVPKFVLASTSSLYGGDNPQPYTEDQDTSRPLSPYAASKKGAEVLCHTYHYLHGLDVTVFRYFTVYGPAGRPDMSLFRFCRWISEGDPVEIFGDGRQSRDFTYVDDVARGTILGLKPLGYEIINLGSDRPVELLRVVELIERETGEKAEVAFATAHAADVRATWANVDKARRLLGWEPQVSLEEGVRRLVGWYRQNRELAKGLRLVGGQSAGGGGSVEAGRSVDDSPVAEPPVGKPVTFEVIIPVYHHRTEVLRCIESILAQTYPCERILVIDNEPQPVLKGDGLDPRVAILHQPIPGAYAARNLGIQHSEASHLAFVDADCVADEGWLEAAVRYMAENPAARILGGPVHIFPRGEHPNGVEAYDMLVSFDIQRSIERWSWCGAGNMIVERGVFSDLGLFREDVFSGGDRDFGIRAARSGIKTYFVSGQLVSHPARRRLARLCYQRMRHLAGARRLEEAGVSRPVEFIRNCRRLVPPVRRVGRFLSGRSAPGFSVFSRMRIAAAFVVVHYCVAFYALYRAAGFGHDPR